MKIRTSDVIKFGRYNWRVLDIHNGKILLLCDRTVKQKPYHNYDCLIVDDIEAPVTWSECSLRQYLNNDFYNKFNEKEKGQIIATPLVNPCNLWYGTDGGEETVDKVFILSIEEVIEYLGNNSGRYKPRGKVKPIGRVIDDSYNEIRKAIDSNGAETSWWLRSPGRTEELAATIFPHGVIDGDGALVSCSNGVRPAMWVNLENISK